MIIFRRKEVLFSAYSRVDAVNKIYGDNKPLGRRFVLEVMKVNEMYDSILSDCTPHWIEKIAKAFLIIRDTKIFQSQSLFSVIDWQREMGS